MSNKVSPVPEGFRTVTPHLIVRDVAAAIEFYQKAFGAEEFMPPLIDPVSGAIVHAEVRIGDSIVMIAEENPGWGNKSPESLGGSAVVIALYVEDVDALAERAVAAGATVVHPVGDQFYGDRGGRIQDPFGHMWALATHVEDMSPEEMNRRFEEFMKQQSPDAG